MLQRTFCMKQRHPVATVMQGGGTELQQWTGYSWELGYQSRRAKHRSMALATRFVHARPDDGVPARRQQQVATAMQGSHGVL